MTTSDPPNGVPQDVASLALAAAMTKEIERLANQFFSGVPGPALDVVAPANHPEIVQAPQAAIPSGVGPNAAHVGAGGGSPAVTLPPIPGPMHRPPLAATPLPKESDLRAMPTLAHENFGTPSPIEIASQSQTPSATPYFLDIAGLPASPNTTTSLPYASLPTNLSPHAPSAPVPQSVQSTGISEPKTPENAASPAAPHYATLPGSFDPEVVADVKTPGSIFDAHAIKKDFPILRERVHGRQIVWLDNAATTQKPQSVIDRISYFYEHENSNVHRAAHTLAARATDAYEGARDKVRRFLNAPSPKQIVFVRGATEGINLIAKSWGGRHVNEGDEIVITHLEHHANIVPWQMLCSAKKAKLRVAPVNDRGEVILEEFEKLIGDKTKVVSFTHVSNALGTINPAKEMVAMAKRYGAMVHVDGAQAVSHMPVDVQSLDCDFYSFSGHKIFAPTGIGAIYGKADRLDEMPPWQGGGNMIADVTFEKTTYQAAPWKFEAGTGNIADAVGLGAALDYVSGLGIENISRYEHELLEYAEHQLDGVPGLHMIACPRDKAGVMSFVLDGVRTEDVGGILDQEGIAVRSGHHCAQPILRRFGYESSVRASLAPYNTKEDIDALVTALKRLQAGRPS
jgi:cysteine desulfurase/selenocysteine lyase